MSIVKRVVFGTMTAALLFGASPAFALSTNHKGAVITTSGAVINIKDAAADNKAVQGQWIRQGSGTVYKLTNTSGYGTTLTYTTGGTITAIKGCIVYTLGGGDDCGGWVS